MERNYFLSYSLIYAFILLLYDVGKPNTRFVSATVNHSGLLNCRNKTIEQRLLAGFPVNDTFKDNSTLKCLESILFLNRLPRLLSKFHQFFVTNFKKVRRVFFNSFIEVDKSRLLLNFFHLDLSASNQ